MSKPSLQSAATELSLAMGQLLRRLRAEVSTSELNLSQLGALARLEQHGGMTTADLARAESMKPQSMGSILSSLEEGGLVQRKPHPTDGRQVLFELTDKGAGARRERRIAKREWLLGAMTKLDPAEQQTLISAIALLKRLGDS